MSCSIGASAGIFACGQPFGVEKRKTAGKRGEGGGAAMLFLPSLVKQSKGSERGTALVSCFGGAKTTEIRLMKMEHNGTL